jgi:hypothetical protein
MGNKSTKSALVNSVPSRERSKLHVQYKNIGQLAVLVPYNYET